MKFTREHRGSGRLDIPHQLRAALDSFGHWDGICHIEADPEPASAPDPTPPAPDPTTSNDLGEAGKKALEAERARAKQFEKELKTLRAQLKAFGDIEPEKAREALQIAQQIEEMQEQQSKLKADIKADIEAEYKQKYEPQLKQQHDIAAQAQLELANYKRDNALERSFLKANGFAGEFELVAPTLRDRVRLNDKDKLEVLDADGEPAYVADQGKSRPMTIAELIAELIEKAPGIARHFKGSDNPTFSISGKGDYNPSDPRMANLTPAQKLNLIRTRK